jgi:hypothetical protein
MYQNNENSNLNLNSNNSNNSNNNTFNENNEKAKSVVLNLETLKAEYDTLLLQYNKAQSDYVNFLKENLSSNAINKLGEIKGQSFWGTGEAGQAQVTANIDECKKLCSSRKNCSGATYNDKDHGSNYCWLRTGEGSAMPSLENDYAIIPKQKIYLDVIKKINIRLSEINNKILDLIKQSNPIYENQLDDRSQQEIILNKNYNHLKEERLKIEKKIQDFYDLDEESENTNLIIKKNYYSYVFSIILLIIAVIILIRIGIAGLKSTNSNYQTGGTKMNDKLSNNTFYVILAIFLLSLAVYFFKK